MHGTEKGKEGTNIKGKQGGTRFDCSKSETKSQKLKVRGASFSELVWFSEEERALSCSSKPGRHSGLFKTHKTFFFAKEYAGTKQETE